MTAEPLNLDWFRDPPASHRSMPLWVWNGEVTEGRITEMLEQFAAQGMGGVFVHPRPGLITEYLSERWFQLWEFALAECQRLGLECNIYDENSYPAGFAGGHVPARLPHAISQYADAMLHRSSPVRWEGELLGAWRMEADGSAVLLPAGTALDDAVKSAPVLTLALRRASGSPWTAWFPMTDITRPEVAREFIATTYEPYAARFGADFGKTVTSIFSDEPLLAISGAYSASIGLPLSRFNLKEFRRDHGYDLLPKLADLFVDHEGAVATRFDYYRTQQRLFTESFLKPLFEWCAARGVRLTGHFMEQEWPDPVLSPSCMEGYRWMQMPGIDLLAPQFDFKHPERNGHYVMTIRELNSAANQLGRPRRLCETHGVGGYGATFEEFKRLSDWVMVHGVNFVNQHLSFETISGARKYDHPQTFSDHNAWWPNYRIVADHVARLSVLLSQGEQRNRVLVLHSTTTGWIECNPARQRLFGKADPLETLRESEARLVQWLVDHQVDFDLGDELLMEAFGKAEGAGLQIAQRRYSVVMVPEGMENWTSATRKLVEEYLAGGGIVIGLRPPPPLVDGRPSPFEIKEGWERVSSLKEMQGELDRLAPPLIAMADGDHLPALVGHQMREFPNGDTLHLLVNTGLKAINGEVRLRGASAKLLDTFTGEAQPMVCHRDGESIVLPMDLPVAGHAAWLVSKGEVAVSEPIEVQTGVMEISDFERIERMEPNVLGLDYCDVTVAGETHRGLYVTRANRLCWQAHGFDRDVWDCAVQFRHNYLDFQFEPDSGFTVEYHFESGVEHCGGLLLAVEHPELYQVTMNGKTVSFEGGSRWLDETIRAAGVGHLLRPGNNTITLRASPFHILCEIERIYLIGDFGLEPAKPGFRMVSPQPLKLGDWTGQGLIQYTGRARYTAHVMLDRTAAGFMVEVPQWAGTVIEVEIDGQTAGCIAFPPWQLKIAQPLSAGEHELSIIVVGSPQNLLGPHFWKVKHWPGPGAWDRDTPAQPAPGADYDITPYGLLGPVRLSLS